MKGWKEKREKRRMVKEDGWDAIVDQHTVKAKESSQLVSSRLDNNGMQNCSEK